MFQDTWCPTTAGVNLLHFLWCEMHDYGHFLPLDEMLISASCMYLPAFSTCYPNNSQYPFIHLGEEKHCQVIKVSRLSAQHDTTCTIQSSKQEFKCKSKLQYNPGSASILISVFFIISVTFYVTLSFVSSSFAFDLSHTQPKGAVKNIFLQEKFKPLGSRPKTLTIDCQISSLAS